MPNIIINILSKWTLLSISAVHQPFYISIWIINYFRCYYFKRKTQGYWRNHWRCPPTKILARGSLIIRWINISLIIRNRFSNSLFYINVHSDINIKERIIVFFFYLPIYVSWAIWIASQMYVASLSERSINWDCLLEKFYFCRKNLIIGL